MFIKPQPLKTKIVTSFVVIFFLMVLGVVVVLPLFTQRMVTEMISLRSEKLIQKLQTLPDDNAVILWLQKQKYLIFSRIGIFDSEHRLIYDSFNKRFIQSLVDEEQQKRFRPEVEEAFIYGKGVNERRSTQLHETYIYRAQRYDFHGKPYVLRVAYPKDFIAEIDRELWMGILGWSVAILALFALLAWFFTHAITRPIREIINTLKSYQEDRVDAIPSINLNLPERDEFGKLAITLNSMSSKIKRQVLALKDFVAYASHELKTPLTIIQGYAETLNDHPELNEEVARKLKASLLRNCERMNALIKDLLFLSDIEATQTMKVANEDLSQIVNQCAQAICQLYPDLQLLLSKRFASPLTIAADGLLLESALMNLLVNACKYSSSPPFISIEAAEDPQTVKLSIADRGMGIPAQDLERIFDRFYTVSKSHSRKMGGAGLGLAIVYSIITKHKGTISVTSEVGKGTTFIVTLPKSI